MRIGYSRTDIDFILDNYQELRAGVWPDTEHSEGGNRRPGISCRARHEDPCLAAGEIAARVKMCGLDGMLVEERYGMNVMPPMTETQIEKQRHIDLYEVLRRINRVKWYCEGSRRKRDYEVWRKENRFHKILRLSCTRIAQNLTSSL